MRRVSVKTTAQAAGRRARALGLRLARRAVWTAVAHDSPVRQRIPDPVVERIAPLAEHLPRQVRNGIDGAITAPTDWVLFGAGSRRPEPPPEPVRVWIAPTNSAGQGRLWAQALEDHVDGVGARNMMVVRSIRFPADQEVAPEIYQDPRWQKEQERYVLDSYTHVLIEAERPIFGTRHGRTCEFELGRLRRAGLTVGLISHGSDLRIPSEHVTLHPHSPFTDPDEELTRKLEAGAATNARILREADVPVFVSTPDLLDYAPQARWCPTVVDPDSWSPEYPLLRRAVPRVVHIPSNGMLKGTSFVDAALQPLHDAGLIDYRRRGGLTHEEVRAAYEEADIVVDQLVLGLYGVAAIEAMAAGRVVLAYLGDVVRRRIREACGLEVPILEADPDTLSQVVQGVLADREAARTAAAAGPEYVRAVHDGRFSAQVLTALTGGILRPAGAADAAQSAPKAEPRPSGASQVGSGSGGASQTESASAGASLTGSTSAGASQGGSRAGAASKADPRSGGSSQAAARSGDASTVGVAPGAAAPAVVFPVMERPVPRLDATRRVFVGPGNYAGQGDGWARAMTRYSPDTSAVSMCADTPRFRFAADYVVDPDRLRRGRWCAAQEEYLGEFFTHVLAESMRPVTGRRHGRHGDAEIAALRARGLNVALIAHGSDIRVPSRHRELAGATSPFHTEDGPALAIREANATRNLRAFEAFDGPRFVSTPDLLDFLPEATWCPVVVDGTRWERRRSLFEAGPPVVAHAPSNSKLKGSDRIDPLMRALDAEGVVRYVRVQDVDPAQMPALYGFADIVLDQFALGGYGVAACEAMASGCVVVGHVPPRVRERVLALTGLELPIVESSAAQVADVVRALVTGREGRERARLAATQGRHFADEVHDGRAAARALADWLG